MSTSLTSRKNLGRIPHLPLAPPGGDPLKGILKKQHESQPLPQQKSTASSLRQAISVPSLAFLSSRFKTASAAAEVSPAIKVPVEIDAESGVTKPSVGFSNRDAVAIIGDTSDDLTTEAENSEKPARRPFLTTPRHTPAAIVSPIRKVSLTEVSVFTPTENGMNASESNGVENGEDSTEDDTVSMQSSSSAAPSDGVSGSHLERWWTGRSTKFVLHCDRRGCNHRHSPPKSGAGEERQLNANSERYETPTQRKNKEVMKLTKELRRCHHELREKERHLSELRSRLVEIESLIDEGRLLDENSRLMQRLHEREDEIREERRIVAERHEIRQRQLIQETVDARAESTRKTIQLEKLSAQLEVAKLDASTMTTPDSDGEGGGGESDASLAVPSQGHYSSAAHLGVSASAPASPSTVDKQRPHQHQVATLTQETMTQLEAYRNEALIWRTKSAQLEIVVKELLLTSEKETQRYTADLSARSDEVNELKETVRRLSILPPAVDGSNQQELNDASALKSKGPTECHLGSCSERKRMLIDENQKLLEQISEKSDGIERLQRELDELGGEYARTKSELDDLRSTHAELGKLAEERKVKCMAAQMTLDRLQIEKDTLKKAISYLESRHQVYQNVILDNNLHVHDESTEEWRHGFADPQFSVYLTKGVQTALTLNELNINEKELAVLQIKLREVEMEFSRDSAVMHDKFAEIERNLVLKTRLIEKLSGQLEQSARRAQLSEEQKQRDREAYQARIDDLAAIAERVPILENEMERAREARSQLEISFRKTTEAFDDHLGDSFKQSLKKQQDLEDYWRQRVENVDEARMKAVAYGEMLEKNVAELKLRHSVERTELERRLASAIAHVELLNARINFPRRDVQCEARPRTANKYVGCKPNQRHKSTAISRGEIPDLELNAYKVDLLLAKRRIEDLEAKLRRHAPQTLLEAAGTRAGSVEHTFGRAYYFKNRDSDTVQLMVGTDVTMREEVDEVSISSSPGVNIDEAVHQRRQMSVCASPPGTEREDYKRLHLEVVVKKLKEANKRHLYEKFLLGEKVHQLESELSELRREELLAKLHGGKVGVSGTGTPGPRRRANSLFVPSRAQHTPALAGRIAPVKRLQIARYKLDELRWRDGEANAASAPDELRAICAELEDVLSHEERRVAVGVPVERFMELKGENDLLLDQLARVKETLGRAELELGIYRREPREETKARQGDARLQRSMSVVELDTASATPQELRMWKERGGALFREVNSLRIALDGCQKQRDEYKRELLMLKGELVLAKCQTILEEERAIRASRWRCRRRSQPGVQWLDELESVVPTSARRVSLSPRRSPLISTSRPGRYSPRGSRDSVRTSDDPHGSVLRRRSQGGFQSPMEKELRIVQEALHRQTTALRDKNRELEKRVEHLELRKLGATASEREEPKKLARVEELENHVITLEGENAMLRTTNDLYEKKVREIEEDQAKMYLIMFRKGQQAANVDIKEDMDAMTEHRVMLRFLHDAFYYYLLNRGSSREHLQVGSGDGGSLPICL